MSSISSTIQNSILSLLLSRLPIYLDEKEGSNISLSSGIHLTNVTLDEEKLESQMPSHITFHVRSAKVDQLDIQVGTDGIKAQVKNLQVVVSPKLDFNQDPNETVDEVMQSVIDLMDVVTVRGLNTDEIDKEYFDDILDDEENVENDELIKSMIESHTISTNDINGKGSWTGYVLSYILSRVKINLEDIKIKIIADPLILSLSIDSVEVETEKTQRKCSIEGIKVGILDVKNNVHDEKEGVSDPINEESNEDSDEYDDDLMSSSFLAESKDQIQQSLMDSANYKSGTMYMTTTSGGFFDANSHLSDPPIVNNTDFQVGNLMIFIEHISFILCSSQSLEIEIGKINASLKHSPEFLTSLLSILIQLNKNPPNNQSKFPKSKSSNQNKFSLNDFNIAEINVSLFSDITAGGQIQSPGHICLKMAELSIQQKGDSFFQGSLMRFGIFENGASLLNFQNDRNTHVDFKFEIQTIGLLRTISVICSNNLQFDLTMAQIKTFIEFYSQFGSVLDKLSVLNDKRSTGKRAFSLNKKRGILEKLPPVKETNEIDFNLSGVHGKVHFNDNKGCLQFDTTGLVFNTTKNFDLGGLEVSYNSENDTESCNLLSISEISLNRFNETHVGVKGYDNNTKRIVNLKAKNIINIGLIKSSLPYSILQTLIGVSKDFSDMLSVINGEIKIESKVQFKNNTLSRMSSSMLLRTQVLDLHFNIKKINFEILNIRPEFGGLELQMDNICVSKHTDGLKNGFVKEVKVNRVYESNTTSFVKRCNPSDNSPMVIFKLQPGTPSVDFINWQLDYYGEWLKIFDQSGVDKYEPIIPKDFDIETVIREKIQKRLKLDLFLSLNDFVIGLSPVNLLSKGLVVFKRATCDLVLYNDNTLVCQMTGDSVSVYLIDDTKSIQSGEPERLWDLKHCLKSQGFVQIGKIGLLNMKLNLNTIESIVKMHRTGVQSMLGVQLNVNEVELGVCSDSLQCFLNLLKDLKQPVLFSKDDKYKPQLTDSIDVFKDIDDNMFGLRDGGISGIFSSRLRDEDFDEDEEESENELSIVDDYYDSKIRKSSPATADDPLTIVPISFYLGVSKINILLYDGYDWKETRNQISEAVLRVSTKAQELDNDESINEDKGESQSVLVEETIYQSIYLGMHTSGNTTDFVKNINDQIGHQNDSQKMTVELGKSSKTKPLKLKRSKNHKISIDIEGLDIDLLIMSNNEPHIGKTRPLLFSDYGVEVVQKITIGVKKFQIIDNVPTSNWNMFMGYLREVGDIEIGKEMIHIDIEINRPISRLAAMDMIMNIQILPLRLHIDQDTLDFLLRFGEFKDQRFLPPVLDDDEIYIQKFSINAIQLKLDYKPKVIDYAGIRSGHTGEFVNLFVLDESRMTLNKLTLFGTYGFQKLNKLLNGYWSPDIKRNQLGGVLSGLAFIKSIVNIGQGVEQLVSDPIRDYQREGKIMRGVQKGVWKFGKTTGGEVLKFGAKLATGTQVILENTEELLGGGGPQRISDVNKSREDDGFKRDDNDLIESEEEEDDNNDEGVEDSEESNGDGREQGRVLSLYSNQPENFSEGLQVAYGSITRNMSTMRQAIVEAGDRAGRSGSVSGAFAEVLRATPVVVIRPLIATSEAISKTLMGGVNELDPEQKRRVEEKYK